MRPTRGRTPSCHSPPSPRRGRKPRPWRHGRTVPQMHDDTIGRRSLAYRLWCCILDFGDGLAGRADEIFGVATGAVSLAACSRPQGRPPSSPARGRAPTFPTRLAADCRSPAPAGRPPSPNRRCSLSPQNAAGRRALPLLPTCCAHWSRGARPAPRLTETPPPATAGPGCRDRRPLPASCRRILRTRRPSRPCARRPPRTRGRQAARFPAP